MLDLPTPSPPKRVGLTPMIDVVFLLLVFFMLASQFGIDRVLPLGTGQNGAAEYVGPPRVISVMPDGLRLNGQLMDLGRLIVAIEPLTQSPTDAIILKPAAGVPFQDLMDVAASLHRAGFTALMVAE